MFRVCVCVCVCVCVRAFGLVMALSCYNTNKIVSLQRLPWAQAPMTVALVGVR